MDNTPSHHNVEIAFEVAKKLDFLPEKFNSKVLFREEGFLLTLMALLENQEIPVHKTPRNAYLYCIEGEAFVNIGGTDYPLKMGEIILLPKDILHGVKAIEKTKLLLLK
ncbi:MAG: cupin domain-containing protein [Saprospiraceae bacterium]|nr:cupin domain-containing protein [Saprospiraceae bacterium]